MIPLEQVDGCLLLADLPKKTSFGSIPKTKTEQSSMACEGLVDAGKNKIVPP